MRFTYPKLNSEQNKCLFGCSTMNMFVLIKVAEYQKKKREKGKKQKTCYNISRKNPRAMDVGKFVKFHGHVTKETAGESDF